ncbi:C40 family peptidase [Levilactobacillus humaensis]|uniref:C40 family peptidase n=1 Tax=Levilactobacillus humaensis TaxID=2950375 RepID=UPI0021C41831|nr:C40 family peptidase [Levilactobacillus humaensis]
MITIQSATAKLLLGTAGAVALLLGGMQTASANTVKVQAGDTVWGFSQNYHVSIKDIVKANSLADANLIYIDQKLEIPTNGQTTAKVTNNTGASTATTNEASQTNSDDSTAQSTTSQSSSSAASSQATQSQAATSTTQASSSSATQTSQAQASNSYAHSSRTTPSQASQSSQTTSSSAATSSSSSQSTGQTSSATSTSGGGVTEALSIAKSGVPYVYGGTSMSGFDCSGLVQYVFGLSARTTYQQTNLGTHHYDVANAPYGAILFWGSDSAPYHDGISLGNGTYVAAQNENDGIGVFSQSNWKPSYYITLN